MKEKLQNLILFAAMNCNDCVIRAKLINLICYINQNDVNIKLNTLNIILFYARLEFYQYEKYMYAVDDIPMEFIDVGNLSAYTPRQLLNLLRERNVHLEGSLSNLAYNADRTRNITMNYLIAAKDALGFGTMTEVLWNLKQMTAVAE